MTRAWRALAPWVLVGLIIGAVGVGGAPGGHLDEQCANAGIDKVKDLLK